MKLTFNSLKSFADAQGIELDESAMERFELYADLLLKFNASMNLIGPMNFEELERLMLIDSLTAAAAHKPFHSILDVGTGAGFPGIPLKIAFPDIPITLVEPRKKRVQFMKIAVNRMKLEDVTIHESRLEDVELGQFGYVISKGFRAPDTWVQVARPYVRDDGVIVAMHAASATLDDVAKEVGLERVHHTKSVSCDFGAHEGDVIRSVSVFAVAAD